MVGVVTSFLRLSMRCCNTPDSIEAILTNCKATCCYIVVREKRKGQAPRSGEICAGISVLPGGDAPFGWRGADIKNH